MNLLSLNTSLGGISSMADKTKILRELEPIGSAVYLWFTNPFNTLERIMKSVAINAIEILTTKEKTHN